ncbi:MAG: hypothetical protein Q9196_000294 [Gyalolechia fulgens]
MRTLATDVLIRCWVSAAGRYCTPPTHHPHSLQVPSIYDDQPRSLITRQQDPSPPDSEQSRGHVFGPTSPEARFSLSGDRRLAKSNSRAADHRMLTKSAARLWLIPELQSLRSLLNEAYGDSCNGERRSKVVDVQLVGVIGFSSDRYCNGRWTARGLFLPKAAIPVDWWNDHSSGWVDWPSESLCIVRSCGINLGSPEQAIQQIEAILLRTQLAFASMGARREIPMLVPDGQMLHTEPGLEPPNDGTNQDEDLDLDENYEVNRGTSHDPWKGLGSYDMQLRLPNTEVWQCERLLEFGRRYARRPSFYSNIR